MSVASLSSLIVRLAAIGLIFYGLRAVVTAYLIDAQLGHLTPDEGPFSGEVAGINYYADSVGEIFSANLICGVGFWVVGAILCHGSRSIGNLIAKGLD
ncbi:MAG: hypothetical protein R3F11_30040 [Verrucomicrobiales bacterium]